MLRDCSLARAVRLSLPRAGVWHAVAVASAAIVRDLHDAGHGRGDGVRAGGGQGGHAAAPGGGCGCGCLGLLLFLVSAVFVTALYLGYLSAQSAGTVYVVAGIGATFGLLLLVLGVLMWVVSVVLD